MITAHHININQTAAEAAFRLASAVASGDARAIKAASISHAYVAEREAKEAMKKAWAYYRTCQAAAEAAYANGSQDLEGGGDCWAVIRAEGAESAANRASEELAKAKEHRAAVERRFNSLTR